MSLLPSNMSAPAPVKKKKSFEDQALITCFILLQLCWYLLKPLACLNPMEIFQS